MKKQTEEATIQFGKLAQFWRSIDSPPSRPSADDLSIYESHFKGLIKTDRTKVIIFGATPELRDLALRYKTNVTSVDISFEMINAMNLLMKQDWHQETLLKCDWLDIPFRDGYFDIAMGDSYLNMLHWDQFKLLIKETRRLLKSGGYLITVMLSYCPKKDLKSIEYSVKEYESGKIALGDLIAMADDNMLNPKTKMVTVNDKFKAFDKLYKEGKIGKSTMKTLDPWRGPLLITKLSEAEFEKLCSPFFKIVAKEYGTDYQCCRYRPLYLLKAR